MSRPMPRSGPLLVAGLAVSALSVACGGAATTAPTAPSSGSPTTAPTVVLVPASDALTQTLTATAGGRSVKHPAGWIGADNMGILYVVSSQAANDRLIGFGSLDAGEVFIQLSEYSILPGQTDDPAVHLPDNLTLLAEGMGLTTPAPAAITSAGRQGARIDAKSDKLSMIAISLKVRDDLFADIIAYVPPGEEAAREQLILSIVESLAYPPS